MWRCRRWRRRRRRQSLQPLAEAELTDEPDKNETSGGLRLRYTTAEGVEVGQRRVERTLPLFLKFQCGRGLKLWLQVGAPRRVLAQNQHMPHHPLPTWR